MLTGGRLARLGAACGAVTAAACLPALLRNPYALYLADLSLIYGLLVLGYDLASGYTGMISFGHAALFGIGGYVSAILVTHAGMSFWLTLPLGAAAAGLSGALVGLTAHRLREEYLAMGTLAFGTIVWLVMLNWVNVTGGPMGIPALPPPPPVSFGPVVLRFEGYRGFYYVLLGAVVLAVLVTRHVVDSRFGRACLAIREDEVVAETLGITLRYHKTLMFAIGAAYSGVAGVLFVHLLRVASPESFDFSQSVTILTMNMLGGMGSIPGALLGAVLVTLLSEALRAVPLYRMVLYGLLLVVMMIFFPYGLAGAARVAAEGLRGLLSRARGGRAVGERASEPF